MMKPGSPHQRTSGLDHKNLRFLMWWEGSLRTHITSEILRRSVMFVYTTNHSCFEGLRSPISIAFLHILLFSLPTVGAIVPGTTVGNTKCNSEVLLASGWCVVLSQIYKYKYYVNIRNWLKHCKYRQIYLSYQQINFRGGSGGKKVCASAVLEGYNNVTKVRWYTVSFFSIVTTTEFMSSAHITLQSLHTLNIVCHSRTHAWWMGSGW